MDKIKQALKKSKFRSSFKLNSKDIEYINKIGMEKVESHAMDFIVKRLASANLINDGKQTPYKGHPVFKAQHATATCCRGCLNKWYKIPKNRQLNEKEINLIKDIIIDWIEEALE